MKPIPAIVLALAAMSAAAEPSRTWTTREGRTFDASLSAADGLRATFTRTQTPPVIVLPLVSLAPADAAIIQEWRTDWHHPLVLPERLGPWPRQAVAPPGEAQARGQSGGMFHYESAHFLITSELQLPAGAINDLARVLEATRAALIAMPLGLHAGGETGRYPVALYRDANSYRDAGGRGGSGGYYDAAARRMLVLLPNLGIEERKGTLRLDYARNLFILKHEVTHQLLDRWHRRLPMWLGEGLAEFVASLPYAQGRYTLETPGAGMHDYLLKWRTARGNRNLRLIPPAQLMAMGPDDWNASIREHEAYDLYNSAAILTYYFIQQDGGTPLAAYIDALRHPGGGDDDADRTLLLRGKSPDTLTKEVIALGKKLGVDMQ